MIYIKSIQRLITELTKLPGIGEKSAQRLAHYILSKREDISDSLSEALLAVKNKIRDCSECYSFTDEEDSICLVCKNPDRSSRQICVVEESFDISKIESFSKFFGLYHVLGGSLSPLNGIGPDQLRIRHLEERILRLQQQGKVVEEVILALDADLEGDTTALYISNLLEGKGIKVSRLAHGIPFGMDIDYIDNRTLGRAFENRIEV